MMEKLLPAVCIFIFCFMTSFFGQYIYTRKKDFFRDDHLRKEIAFAPIYISLYLFFLISYAISPIENDFIFDLSFYELFIPLTLGGMIYALGLFKNTAKYMQPALIFSIILSTMLLPTEYLLFKGYLPFWADRLGIMLFWFIVAYFYYIINGIEGIFPTYNLMFGIGLFGLTLLNAAPLFYGFIALSLISVSGSFMIFNWFPAKIKISKQNCQVLGFLIGWICCFGGTENLSPCFVILLSLYLVELFTAGIKRITLREKYANLTGNTVYYQANLSGLSQENVCFSIMKVQVVFVILSCFQIYIPNMFSLPIISLVLAGWFLNKLQNWQDPQPSLKELNKNLIDGISKIKNEIGRD